MLINQKLANQIEGVYLKKEERKEEEEEEQDVHSFKVTFKLLCVCTCACVCVRVREGHMLLLVGSDAL